MKNVNICSYTCIICVILFLEIKYKENVSYVQLGLWNKLYPILYTIGTVFLSI